MDDLISRTWLLAEYDKRHKGPSGGARKLIEEAPSALGTNLAEVSTDLISRQAAVDMLMERASTLRGTVGDLGGACSGAAKLIMQMPSAEPQIIYCKDCVKHNRRIGDFKEMPNGEVIWYWKYNACPLAEFRGKAQGHEFDYQFCAYGERRTE